MNRVSSKLEIVLVVWFTVAQRLQTIISIYWKTHRSWYKRLVAIMYVARCKQQTMIIGCVPLGWSGLIALDHPRSWCITGTNSLVTNSSVSFMHHWSAWQASKGEKEEREDWAMKDRSLWLSSPSTPATHDNAPWPKWSWIADPYPKEVAENEPKTERSMFSVSISATAPWKMLWQLNFGNAILAILRQSQRDLISRFWKNGSNLVVSSYEF